MPHDITSLTCTAFSHLALYLTIHTSKGLLPFPAPILQWPSFALKLGGSSYSTEKIWNSYDIMVSWQRLGFCAVLNISIIVETMKCAQKMLNAKWGIQVDWKKLQKMIYAESQFLIHTISQAFLCPESYKPFWTRNCESHIFIDGHLRFRVQWQLAIKHGFTVMQWKVNNVIHNNLLRFVWGK